MVPEKQRALLRPMTDPEQPIPLERGVTIVGRERQSDIALTDPSVSQPHASIEFRSGLFYIRDMRSTNGTWLDFIHGSKPKGSIRRILSH